MFVSVGAYTESPAGTTEGISVYRFDPQTGALSPGQPEPAAIDFGVVLPDFRARRGRRLA